MPVVKRVSQPTEICSIFLKCGDMQTSMGTNFGDAPNRLKPFNEHDLAIQHAFAHIISTRTGCPSVFFSCGFGQVYRNEFESRRCCYYYSVIIIILLSSVGGQINNNNTIIIITRPWIGPIPPRTCGRRGVKKTDRHVWAPGLGVHGKTSTHITGIQYVHEYICIYLNPCNHITHPHRHAHHTFTRYTDSTKRLK